MRFGPTSLQVSSVLAKGLRRPKLRQDLRISEQTVAGETSYVIKVEETFSYNRYGATEYAIDVVRAPPGARDQGGAAVFDLVDDGEPRTLRITAQADDALAPPDQARALTAPVGDALIDSK
jgi:hypothetical protein